ncbi:MAG: winged helix-turn-helix transcriptional regulator [Dehalococcoidia bacterium]
MSVDLQPSRGTELARKYRHPCLIAQTLDVLGDRWTLLILRDLMSGLHRYSDILDNCAGMSPNVLSDRLKRLEAEGIVQRTYHRELPPRVDYTLTEKGWAVRPILLSLIDWGRSYAQPFDLDTVGSEISTDFAVRMLPTFSFNADRAEGLTATMVLEVADCADCNTWSFEIRDGHILPRRRAIESPDVRLVTTTRGFIAFIRGELPPAVCGNVEGSLEIAARIQSCFTIG